MNKIKELVRGFTMFLRHRKFKNAIIKNPDVTILCNCCIGGAMYNDVGLRFRSPTINLFFGHHGFIDLVTHLDEYSDAELIDTGEYDLDENNIRRPICRLVKSGMPDITIHFLHYDSFEEAKEKWVERYKRINRDKIFCVIEAAVNHEHELMDEYVSLPYSKIIFTDLPSNNDKSIRHMGFYDMGLKDKSITGFIDIWGKRGYDDYDFVNEIFNKDY